MTEKDRPAVLIVDDDTVFHHRLRLAFEVRGWEAHVAASGKEALTRARDAGPDLAIVDLRLQGESGLDIVKNLRESDSTISIIVLTGYGSIATALEAVRRGADHYLSKPVDVDQILAAYEAVNSSQPSESVPPSTVPTLARVEWEHIQRILTDCGGNVSQAAKLLGLHRRSLQRKLLKYPPRT